MAAIFDPEKLECFAHSIEQHARQLEDIMQSLHCELMEMREVLQDDPSLCKYEYALRETEEQLMKFCDKSMEESAYLQNAADLYRGVTPFTGNE